MKIPDDVISAMGDVRVSIDELLYSYENFLANSSKAGKVCPTIDEFEDTFVKLNEKTREVWARLAADTIDAVDEKEIIASKKENT